VWQYAAWSFQLHLGGNLPSRVEGDLSGRIEARPPSRGELGGAVENMPYVLKRRALLALDLRVTVHPKTHDPRWEATPPSDRESSGKHDRPSVRPTPH